MICSQDNYFNIYKLYYMYYVCMCTLELISSVMRTQDRILIDTTLSDNNADGAHFYSVVHV